MEKLTGTLLYVQLHKPVKAYVEKGAEAKPDEWKASIALVDEDEVDAYEEYARELNAKVSVKKVRASDFETHYKTPVPEGAGKNVWVITLRKSTELGKTGKPVPELYKPKVFERVGSTLVDVTNTKLPANGSKGAISIDVFKRNNNTSSFYLKNVLVTEMIEYTPPESDGNEYEPGSEFGSEAAPAKAAKPVPAKKAAQDDDSPF